MKLLLQHASLSFFANAVPIAPRRAAGAAFSRLARPSKAPAICWSCQFRASSMLLSRGHRAQLNPSIAAARVSGLRLSSSKDTPGRGNPSDSSQSIPMPPPPSEEQISIQGEQPALTRSEEQPSTPSDIQDEAIAVPPHPTADAEPGRLHSSGREDNADSKRAPTEETLAEEKIARVAAEDLPSHREEQRWDFSKRISEFMDELLPKLAVVTQKVNTYTGTDYTSIAALKQEIKDQEKLVKARRQAIEEAKQALDAAHSQQGASQKEVVALLERKHSWSAMDLERYMSLIRSEHLNDQAIREAKEAVLAAENSLEEARAQLEKRERAQYHEEQIWSDTIRRNSTWVTFGLMGLNIFLLLASLVVFEPWRRKRMVREIKAALEEAQRPVIAPTPVPATTAIFTPAPTTVAVAATIPATAAIEAEIDKVVEPVGPLLDGLAAEAAPPDASVTREAVSSLPETLEAVPTETTTTSDTADLATESPATATLDPIEELATTDIEAELDHDRTRLEEITAKLEELVSDEQISVRKKDLTATVCASAAAGWVCAMIAFWIGTR